MSRNGKVIVAMSGGVDSSVAACLLKEQGYECVGVFLRVGAHAPEPDEVCASAVPGAPPARRLRHGCCSAGDAADARSVAARLGIPFYALNFEREFERIIDYFVNEYRQARTPNPCVVCNIEVKFGRLFQYAAMMDASYVASGHYARIIERAGGPCLARAKDSTKDQSYVLFGIRREDLPRCLFPLGDLPKRDVRKLAASLGLAVHDKPDSQEICFVPDNDYTRLLAERAPETQRTGEVVDQRGRLLGTHGGVGNFTIGQRRGLRLALGTPTYVTRLDAQRNQVTVGSREDLFSDALRAADVNWLTDPPPCRAAVDVKIRYMHTPAPATLIVEPDRRVQVRFAEPQAAVTPGQAAVFYDHDVVLGGGWITESTRRD
ncbi:MAG: tRNA-specific 2-thiouridylase MnmA [Phycisphaerae bacterium]|nr:tRNA-specific 2-thiouridylase MnmA [Phycisphaerae bacterium]